MIKAIKNTYMLRKQRASERASKGKRATKEITIFNKIRQEEQQHDEDKGYA